MSAFSRREDGLRVQAYVIANPGLRASVVLHRLGIRFSTFSGRLNFIAQLREWGMVAPWVVGDLSGCLYPVQEGQ